MQGNNQRLIYMKIDIEYNNKSNIIEESKNGKARVIL